MNLSEGLNKAIKLLDFCLSSKGVSSCHGLGHAICVLNNAIEALKYYEDEDELTDNQKILIMYASLLHDADDHKFFPDHHDYENLRSIMNQVENITKEEIDEIIYMINLVSSSKNGDSINGIKHYHLIPRYADRLEAIGLIGIERCYIYNKHNQPDVPFILPETPLPKTEKEIEEVATMKRYRAYTGKSKSIMDHFYDKLYRLSFFPIRNSYFDKVCKQKRQILIDFILLVGEGKIKDKQDMNLFINDNSL